MTVFAEVNGIRLFYETVGEGRPLVMLHGNGEDHTIFAEAAELLGERFACYLLDSRGHGQSTPVSELHYADMAEDLVAFLDELDLRDVTVYGFSDSGIVALLAAARCRRIATLIVSGANLTPQGVKAGLRLRFRIAYLFKKDPKIALMLQEPHISDETLRAIRARTLVLAGSRDIITPRQTRRLAATIPGAELQILEGEDHGSYIVHRKRIGELIRAFASE